jgi:hypothetical protein
VNRANLTIEAGAAEDLGRHRRAAVHTVVETLLLDRPGDGLVEASGDGWDGVDDRCTGQDRGRARAPTSRDRGE